MFPNCINDLHVAIKYPNVHHFAVHTNIFNFNTCVTLIIKQVNYDLKSSGNWLKANKISLNINRTDLALFTLPKKQLDSDLKARLCGFMEKIQLKIWEFTLKKV